MLEMLTRKTSHESWSNKFTLLWWIIQGFVLVLMNENWTDKINRHPKEFHFLMLTRDVSMYSHPRSEEPTCPVWRKFIGWPICDLSIRGLLQKTLRWVNHHFTSCIYNSSKPHVFCCWWSDTNTQLAINPAAPVGGKIWVGFKLSNDYFYRSCICNAQEKTLLVSVYCRLIMWAPARYKD